MRYLFVGDRRSKLAQRMGVRWEDGHLAAATLFAALYACGLDPHEQVFRNVRTDDGQLDYTELSNIRWWGLPVIALGREAWLVLRRAEIPCTLMVHPAARGAIRKKENYQAHVREVLESVRSERDGVASGGRGGAR